MSEKKTVIVKCNFTEIGKEHLVQLAEKNNMDRSVLIRGAVNNLSGREDLHELFAKNDVCGVE